MNYHIEWHRLVDGDPPATGRYIVASPYIAKLAIYRKPSEMPLGSGVKGWDQHVSFATHWAKEPHAPDDGTPQLCRDEGQCQRSAADEAKAWADFQSAVFEESQ